MNEFASQVASVDPDALRASSVATLQMNLGLKCNMSCAHCHHRAGPGRTELMSREVLEAAIGLAGELRPALVDLTGGAPELHPLFRELLVALGELGLVTQVRTNLTALLEPGSEDLPELFARLRVRVLASLPSWDPVVVDGRRGAGTAARCMIAIRRLAENGYGLPGGLRLDLACDLDPSEAAGSRASLEASFRRELEERYGVRFEALAQLVTMPLGRRRGALGRAELDRQLELLAAGFNPATVPRLACRSTLALAWDGALADCDFNIAAGLPIEGRLRLGDPIDLRALSSRRIRFGRHCFACTVGAGSS